jgi:hypothetical protein
MPADHAWFGFSGHSLLHSIIAVRARSFLIAWWPGEGETGGITPDIIGGHDATILGASFDGGAVGQAFSFDGASYLGVSSSDDLKFSGPFTIEAWVKCNSIGDNNTIIAKGPDYDTAGDWALAISESGTLRVHAMVNGNWYCPDCNTSLTPGTWNHVAMVYDGSRLAAGGTKHHAELLAPFGLDASDPAFWDRGLGVISGFVDELEKF